MPRPALLCAIHLVLVCAVHRSEAAFITREAADDAIKELPGWGKVQFGLYGGYITVDQHAGRALYYLLAEHVSDPDSAPLALWLNGGPGCSSVGGGFMSELGPFYPSPGEDGRKLERNELSWNNVANVIFLESPAFVGFSYSNSSEDHRTGDGQTTQDTLTFLLEFFERFPQYKGRDFWITGESYAGHYVPLLSEAIINYNHEIESRESGGDRGQGGRKGGEQPINLKGVLLGNPWTDAVVDNVGQVDFLVSHFLMSQLSGRKILEHCDIYTIWPLPHNHLPNTTAASGQQQVAQLQQSRQQPSSQQLQSMLGPIQRHPDADLCRYWMDTAFEEIGAVDVYDIYEDVCTAARASRELGSLANVLSPLTSGQILGLARKTMGGSTPEGTDHSAGTSTPGSAANWESVSRKMLQQGTSGQTSGNDAHFIDPCIADETLAYLNRPEVQSALHANTTALPYPWTFCAPGRLLHYSLDDSVESMVPVYERLIRKADLNIVVYSGTVDAAVPTTGTQRWVEGLGLPISRGFRAWMDPSGQVGGHVVEYEGLTFVMVAHAGHMVPYTQPERALHMVRTFMNGGSL